MDLRIVSLTSAAPLRPLETVLLEMLSFFAISSIVAMDIPPLLSGLNRSIIAKTGGKCNYFRRKECLVKFRDILLLY